MVGFDERRRFASHFALCHDASTSLPFTVGGVTQHGWHAEPRNNQDAMAVWIDEGTIVAAVADGCASSAPTSKSVVSFNEVGSRLTCLAALRAAREQIRMSAQLDDRFVEAILAGVRRMAMQVLRLAGRGSRSETVALRERLLFDFVMSTLLLTVITLDRYLVLAVGDGFIRVNGAHFDLAHMSGQYLANELLAQIRRGALVEERSAAETQIAVGTRWVHTGSTADLGSLVLASDGVVELFAGHIALLDELQCCSPERSYSAGYDPLFFREFRCFAARIPSGPPNQDSDDQTLVVIRRIADAHDVDRREVLWEDYDAAEITVTGDVAPMARPDGDVPKDERTDREAHDAKPLDE